jgi:hypothetical protein
MSKMPHRIWLALLVCVLCLLACSRKQGPSNSPTEGSTHRVVVYHPEQWSDGDYRNCYLGPKGLDVNHGDLPTLDCDLHSHETPRSRIFVIDVQFSGSYPGVPNEDGWVEWTCQRSKETLVCKR